MGYIEDDLISFRYIYTDEEKESNQKKKKKIGNMHCNTWNFTH